MDDILKDRISALKSERDRAKEALDRIKLRPTSHAFDAQAIERFGKLMRENIASGWTSWRWMTEPSASCGDKATLEQVIASDQNANPKVRSFVRKWRAIQNKTPYTSASLSA